VADVITRKESFGWCNVPYDQLEQHPVRKIPFRLCRDSAEIGTILAQELVNEIAFHNTHGEFTRAIIPCGPRCCYEPFMDLVNVERVSLKQLLVFRMDKCLEWQARELLPRGS
jgi:glucosamine-6-phosphate deaminase